MPVAADDGQIRDHGRTGDHERTFGLLAAQNQPLTLVK
jgi:hypothetical protein